MTRSFKMHKPKAPRRAVRPLAAADAGKRAARAKPAAKGGGRAKEIGGPSGPEPTRYGDWERNGICYDF